MALEKSLMRSPPLLWRQQAIDVVDMLSDLFILRGVPGHIRSDNGPEFISQGSAGMDCCGGYQNRLHRARESIGERIRGKLQCPPT
jgi:hypothetical protein